MIALALLASAAEPEAKPDAKPAAEITNGDDAKRCGLLSNFRQR